MPRHAARPDERPLYLSQEEALALLDLCLLANGEHEAMRSGLLCRVSDLCREFMRSRDPDEAGAASVSVQCRVERLLRASQTPVVKTATTPN